LDVLVYLLDCRNLDIYTDILLMQSLRLMLSPGGAQSDSSSSSEWSADASRLRTANLRTAPSQLEFFCVVIPRSLHHFPSAQYLQRADATQRMMHYVVNWYYSMRFVSRDSNYCSPLAWYPAAKPPTCLAWGFGSNPWRAFGPAGFRRFRV
jgi:hypothetical protein